jgi:hypothetical protein
MAFLWVILKRILCWIRFGDMPLFVWLVWGRPLKGLSLQNDGGQAKRKNTFPLEKQTFFSLHFRCCRIRYCAVVDYFVPHPLFLSMVRVVFDPHQSPIWKEIGNCVLNLKTPPLPLLRTRKSSVPLQKDGGQACRLQLNICRSCGYEPTPLWLSA